MITLYQATESIKQTIRDPWGFRCCFNGNRCCSGIRINIDRWQNMFNYGYGIEVFSENRAHHRGSFQKGVTPRIGNFIEEMFTSVCILVKSDIELDAVILIESYIKSTFNILWFSKIISNKIGKVFGVTGQLIGLRPYLATGHTISIIPNH